MISPSQRHLPDNTQHSQQTNIHAPGGIRTHDRSRRAAVDPRLRPRGYWDQHLRQQRAIKFCVKLRKKAEGKKILQKAIGRPMDTASILQKGKGKWLTALEGRDQILPSLLTDGRKLTLLEFSSS